MSARQRMLEIGVEVNGHREKIKDHEVQIKLLEKEFEDLGRQAFAKLGGGTQPAVKAVTENLPAAEQASSKVDGRRYSREPLTRSIPKLLDSQPEKIFSTHEIAKSTGRKLGAVIAAASRAAADGEIAKVRPGKGYRSILSKETPRDEMRERVLAALKRRGAAPELIARMAEGQ